MKLRPYTLLEVVIALAIFATAMALAGAGLSASVRSWEKVGRSKERMGERLALDSVANNVIRNAIPFSWPDSDTKGEKQVFKGERDMVRLAARRWIGSNAEGGMSFVELGLNEGRLFARYSKIPITDDTPEPGCLAIEDLATNVAKVSFLYAERNSRDEIVWSERWDSEKDQNLPLAIQMSVEWIDGSHESWLRRTAGSGLRESFGIRKAVSEDAQSGK